MKDSCVEAMVRVHELTARLASGGGDPLRDAHEIYWLASDAGAWDADECEELAGLGAEFLQLGEALEVKQDNLDDRMRFESLIRQAAAAVERGEPLPEWGDD